MRKEAISILNHTILPFWRQLRDDVYGGYYGFVNFDLKCDYHAVKGCILNSRILWFFSEAARMLKNDELLDEAKHAYEFLRRHCLDAEYGGIYWSVCYDGQVEDSTKHTYNQAFAIYALSAYYKVSGDHEALGIARSIYRLIEEKCTDSYGYCEAFDRKFNPISNEKLSENGVLADKTMNTLLHVFEGYSGLYEAAHDADTGQSLRRIVERFLDTVYNPKKQRQEVFFDREWHSLLDLQSYGHDIETSWLMDRGCSLLGDAELSARLSAVTSALVRKVYRTAFHKDSVWNECKNGVVDKTRIWWVQAESVLGFWNEYEKSGDKTYCAAAEAVLHYIETYLIDKRPGSEWFWDVDDDGKPSSQKPIVEPWKCPYHNGRMCLEIIRRTAHASS